MTQRRIRIVTGVGRFSDPWHPYAETSPRISDLLTERGHQVETTESTPEAFTDLVATDLLILNLGGGTGDQPRDASWLPIFDGLGEWIEAGHPILAIHAAANAFPDWPAWRELLGGLWVRGVSHHPPRTEFTFDVAPAGRDHPAVGGLTTITTLDERYSELDVADGSVPLLQHRFDDKDQIMVWAVEKEHRRAIYDGLGHNLEAYDSPDRCQLLASEVAWLLDQDDHEGPESTGSS